MDRDLSSILSFVQTKLGSGSVASLLTQIPFQPVDPGAAQTINEAVAAIFKKAADQLEDGFQLKDVVPIFSVAITEMMGLANQLAGATGEQKLEFVTAACVALYNFIDRGLDGTHNRIHIPWVPQVIENCLEQSLLPAAIRLAVEAVITVWKAKTA